MAGCGWQPPGESLAQSSLLQIARSPNDRPVQILFSFTSAVTQRRTAYCRLPSMATVSATGRGDLGRTIPQDGASQGVSQ